MIAFWTSRHSYCRAARAPAAGSIILSYPPYELLDPTVVATLVPALVAIPQIPSIPLTLSSRNEGVAVWEGLGLPSLLFIFAIGLTLRKRGLLCCLHNSLTYGTITSGCTIDT